MLSDQSLERELEEDDSIECITFSVMCVILCMMIASYRSRIVPSWDGRWGGFPLEVVLLLV